MYYIYFINEIINEIKWSNFLKKQSKCYKCSPVGNNLLLILWKSQRVRASVSVAKKSELFNVNDNADENNLFLLRYRYPVIIYWIIAYYRPTPGVGGVSVIKLTKNNRVNKIKHYSDWKNSIKWLRKFS